MLVPSGRKSRTSVQREVGTAETQGTCQVCLMARGCLLLSTGVCVHEESCSQNFVRCDPHCGQGLSPHRLTSPLAVSAEDLLLICKLNDIKNFSSSQRQVLPSAPLLHCCGVDHHLRQDLDASFELKHKQKCCCSAATPGECELGRPNCSPFLEKADPSLPKWSVGLV